MIPRYRYHKVVWAEHLFYTCLEAQKPFLAINCSKQRQQQSHMGQALFGLIKPGKM